MATFSTNQVRQLYVAKALGTVAPGVATGTIEVKSDSGKTHLYFKYMGPGGQVRSDLIDIKNIAFAKASDANSMIHKFRKYKVSLDANVNGGAPIAGQDYVLRIAFRNYIGLSEEDQYFKYGIAHAVTGMTAEQLYQILYSSLQKNMSREISKLVELGLSGTLAKVTLTTNSGLTVTAKDLGSAGNSLKFAVASITETASAIATSVANGVTTITASLAAADATIGKLADLVAANATASKLISISGTAVTAVVVETAKALAGGAIDGVIIEEAEQPWILGTMRVAYLNFTAQPTTVYDGVEDRIWGVVTELTPTTSLKNGKMIADMEYFYMGERGDQYRNMGWPNIIKTTYLADSTIPYNTIDIHYAYQGPAEDIQKSQKDITLVIPKVGATNDVSNVLANSVITAINTATELSIPLLSVE